MIISFDFGSSLNEKGIEALKLEGNHTLIRKFPYLEFEKNEDSKLILLSLKADGSFQKKIAPKILANKLLENGLPSSVKEIEIIVSDADEDSSLLNYGMSLGKAFLNQGRKLTIKTSMHNEGKTRIVPPEEKEGDWHVYLLKSPEPEVFKGKIQEFLQDCTLTPKEISSNNQLPEISKNPFYQP
ncbi:hypothetical protein [Legionella fairfieldensis]|uniref:hypothetical protein n=1 Tax=Legionella fairfieldensis TaxID=45064 RepID=UPI00048D0054|nr:hypothetical protein [Legionella fairfieldensis]